VLAYGGALHNDTAPRPQRAAWSFGPELMQRTGGRYIELDLIVADYIQDNDAWRSLPWYAHRRPRGTARHVAVPHEPRVVRARARGAGVAEGCGPWRKNNGG
jgi:hypothetical protein